MKRLLATTAIALVAMASTASAQSVLERVLGQIDNSTNLASVNGTFANIAENLGGLTPTNTYSGTAITSASANIVNIGTELSQELYDENVARLTVQATYASVAGDQVYYDQATGEVIRSAAYNALSAGERGTFNTVASGEYLVVSADGFFEEALTLTALNTELANRTADLAKVRAFTETTTYAGGIEGINGSITNIIDGIDSTTQQAVAGGVTATEFVMPTLDFGDMATTALGAVNTGDITLGVNSSIDNAKTSSTEALSVAMAQIGGSADTGAIVLNIASNMTGVNGSISNTMTEVNGTVGNLSTTALGAVNTGTIISGVNAAVTGITGASAGQ